MRSKSLADSVVASCKDQESVIKRRKVADPLLGSEQQVEQYPIGGRVAEQEVNRYRQDRDAAAFHCWAAEPGEQAAATYGNAFNRKPIVLEAPVSKARERRLGDNDVPEFGGTLADGGAATPIGADTYDLAAGPDGRGPASTATGSLLGTSPCSHMQAGSG